MLDPAPHRYIAHVLRKKPGIDLVGVGDLGFVISRVGRSRPLSGADQGQAENNTIRERGSRPARPELEVVADRWPAAQGPWIIEWMIKVQRSSGIIERPI